jgi:hypothetical protein
MSLNINRLQNTMPKKPSLNEVLANVSHPKHTSSSAPAGAREAVTPSRHGKKVVAGHFDPAVSRQLHHIALEEDTSVQALLQEAINDLFTKRGKPPVA